MMEIMQPHLQFPSSSSSIKDNSSNSNDGSHQESSISISYRGNTEHLQEEGVVGISGWRRERKRREREEGGGGGDQLSLLGVFVTVFRKSLVGCKSNFEEHLSSSSSSMEISWPSNVRHVAHVTFDRFNGFLGLPVEFEPDVPRRPPSASTRVFGVSTECMQLSFDSRGNSVPTILLMMQWRLYSQGGLQAEGIFRINAENGQEEFVREQLNSGIIPNDIDVHCLAGLIKAWFRELPRGILDSLSPEEVMHAQSEDECVRLVRLLPSTEAALLDWAINLMADVAQLEHLNKMNARNVAMVFAPNMTQMADPLTALMYAVQVMNFLKMLVVRTLKDREESVVEAGPAPQLEPFDENGHCSASHPIRQKVNEIEEEQDLISKGRPSNATNNSTLGEIKVEKETHGYLSSIENILPDGKGVESDDRISEITKLGDSIKDELGMFQPRIRRTKSGKSSSSNLKKGSKKVLDRPLLHVVGTIEKGKEVRVVSCLNLQTERVEAWR